MKRYRLGLYLNDEGRPVVCYVNNSNEPSPYQKIVGRTILLAETYKGISYAEARLALLERAATAGAYDPDFCPPPATKAPPAERPAASRSVANRRPVEVNGSALYWSNRLRLLAKANYTERVPPALLLKLAGLVALVGGPGSAEALQAHNTISCLFFPPKQVKRKDQDLRISRWARAVEAIPPTAEALALLTLHVRTYDTIVRDNQLKMGNYKLDQVIACMIAVPAPEVYVKHVTAGGLTHPGVLYHPNTLEAARQQLPGALGRRAEQSSAHAEHVRKKVKIVAV